MSDAPFENPAHWPAEILPLLTSAFTCEYASFTRAGQPITVPITPHLGQDGRSIDVGTGLAYPLKAERARGNKRVSLLFSDGVGSGLAAPTYFRVLGEASVRDADLQQNLDRYVALSRAKFNAISRWLPKRWQRQGAWYYARIWVEITPLEIHYWESARLDRPPVIWKAEKGTKAPPSDPKPGKPAGKGADVFRPKPGHWRGPLRYALANLGLPVVTVPKGRFPLPIRTLGARLRGDTLYLKLGQDEGEWEGAKACVTFHAHPKRFTSQENVSFVGKLSGGGLELAVKVERQVGTFSLGSNPLQMARSVLAAGPKLHKRLKAEASRRGQPIPQVRM